MTTTDHAWLRECRQRDGDFGHQRHQDNHGDLGRMATDNGGADITGYISERLHGRRQHVRHDRLLKAMQFIDAGADLVEPPPGLPDGHAAC